jgi:hypothetical protein
MAIKRKEIKAKNYYISLGCFIVHFGVIIYMIIRVKPSQFFPHLTNWSFLLSTLYLFSVIISDSNLFFFAKDNLEKFNYFFRNTFSKIAYPYCYLITLGFWIILIIGFITPIDTFIEKGTKITGEMIFINLYVHLIVTIILTLDLFLYEREEIKFNWFSIIANSIIFIVYIISILIEKYVFDFYAYYFVKDINVLGIILVALGLFVLLGLSIFLYNCISNKINRKKNEDKKNEPEQDLNNKEGIFEGE